MKEPFANVIDELAIDRRALTAKQVASRYEPGRNV